MPAAHGDGNGRRIVDAISVVVLYGLLALPLVGMLLGWQGGGAALMHARRPLPGVPRDLAALAASPAEIERWFEDALAFRGLLVRWSNAADVLWLGDSPTFQISPEAWVDKRAPDITSGVFDGSIVRGTDGWLFYFSPPLVDDFRALDQPTPRALRSWEKGLQRRRRVAESVGARYLLVVVPEKQSVYPEHVPQALTRLPGPRWSESLIGELERTTHIPILRLQPALERAKAAGDVYPRTGTHWNEVGARIADREIVQRLAGWFPALSPPPDPSGVVRARRGGLELALFLGLQDVLAEDMPRLELPPPRARVVAQKQIGHARELVKETGDAELPTAVVFHDSFTATGLEPMLSESFERVTYVWRDGFDAGVVAAEHPEVVIEIRVERFFLRDQPPPVRKHFRAPAGGATQEKSARAARTCSTYGFVAG